MFFINTIANNDILLYSLCTFSICLIAGFYLKSYYSNSITQSSPPTFNFTQEQLNEILEELDRGENLDQQVQDRLDEDFRNMLGAENYAQFQQDLDQIHAEAEAELVNILNNIDLFL
uniref:Uncharacterized protein n=1 Tax=Russula compacta TaxID=40490 RepID=A0A2S0U3M4_9AGAM|nr:hypothetical protein [Russula compacta]AWB36086.1 hypothetical protein [Russula compacta]